MNVKKCKEMSWRNFFSAFRKINYNTDYRIDGNFLKICFQLLERNDIHVNEHENYQTFYNGPLAYN
jgi:hypothetical protein